MAVLKYERFIVKMSMEQKVKLITSSEFFKSSSVGGYDFPVFNITNQPFGEECKGLHATQFPDDSALASSWNTELVADVYNAIGEECHAVNSFAYFNCTNDLAAEDIASAHFVLGKFLAGKVAGLGRADAFVNFEDRQTEDEEQALLMRGVRDTVLNAAQPSSMIFSDVEEAERAVKRFRYGGLVYGIASTVEEALDYFYSGASFVFLATDIEGALSNKLTSLTNAYKTAHTKYVNDRMTEASFARLVRTFKVFDGEIIDRACDNIIDVVFRMQSMRDGDGQNYKSLKKGENALFDEINHNELAIEAARQSAVLLKNEGGLLPLNRSMQIAVLGEYAKDVKYQRAYYNFRATGEKLPFEAINDYELNTVGFGLGYSKGEVGRGDLLDHAVMLGGKADCILLYLAADKGADRLPPEQMELLNAVAGKRAKIVAIVACAGNIDMGFADKCDAVLLTYVSGQGGTVAALDIVTGAVSPSGRLTKAAGITGNGGFIEKYPVGSGLSYTRFEYSNLKVNESGVSFTVRNTGAYDGYSIPLMYVKKKNTKSVFSEDRMRGFTKVFVAQGDAVRVKIPFDDMTFSLYTKERGYYVEGGMYTVSVENKDSADRLSGILLLKDYEENKSFKNRVVETADDGRAVQFSESGLPENVKAARKKLPFGLKLALALMLAVYVDAVLAIFAIGNFVANKDFIFYIVIGVIALAVNALVVVYIILAAKRRRSEKYLHPNVVLTDMLDNVEDFTEIAKVKYKLPIEEEKPAEEEKTEEQAAAEAAEEELAATYEVKFDESEKADVAISGKVSFAELCANLKDYALDKGINLEAASARALTAAMASAKVVFLTSKNAELLPKFVKLLNDYYGCENPISASDGWHSLTDLLWTEGDGKFVLSDFSNAVYNAHKSREQQCALIIDNVNIENLGSYFFNFLEYANHPTEEYIISFNEETSFRLPDNLTYILVPQNGTLDALPQEMLNASMIVEVMLSEAVHEVEAATEPKVISHEDFKLMLSEAKEEYFVSERIWKKVDALAESIAATERFAIGNKNTIQMESFTSVFMECGAEEAEAVTYMFLTKLAYILKNTRAYRQEEGDKNIYATIEKLFVDEELGKIKRALTKTVKVEI